MSDSPPPPPLRAKRPPPLKPAPHAGLLERICGEPAERQLEILRGHGSIGELVPAIVEQALALTAQGALSSDQATHAALELARRAGTPLDQAQACRARARAQAIAGRFQQSLEVCEQGMSIAQHAGHDIERARLGLAAMHALCELGRLDEAIELGESARARLAASGEQALAARADINLGIAHHRHDHPDAALACFDRARTVSVDDPLFGGHIENNRGTVLVALNKFDAARAAFGRAVEVFKAGGSPVMAAIAEGNLADLETRQGHLQTALAHFERARRHLENSPAASHAARLAAEQAEAVGVLGLPHEALAGYQAAIAALDEFGLAFESARARAGAGLALLKLGQLEQADHMLRHASSAFEQLRHSTAHARVERIRAELALHGGDLQNAEELARRALECLNDRPAETVAVLHVLARIAIAQQRAGEAQGRLDRAMKIATELDLPSLRSDVLATLGALHRRQGRTLEAIECYSAAIEQIERLRGSLQADRYRASFLGDRSSIYEALVDVLLGHDDPASNARAFELAEKAKGRVLLEQMRSTLDTTPPAASDDHERTLMDELSRVRAELNVLYSRAEEGSSAATDTWRSAVHERERRIDELETRLGTTRGGSVLFAPTADVASVHDALDRETALVEYFVIEGRIMAFVMRPGGLNVFRNLADADHVLKRQQNLQFQLNRALRPGAMDGPRAARLLEDALRELRSLHDLLIAPLAHAIEGASRLVIVPHGSLHVLPYQALWNGANYLIEEHELQVVPSASLLVRLNENGGQAIRSALVVGVADEVAPHIDDEAELVARLLGDECHLLVGAQATAERLIQAASHADLVHLACHGRFSIQTPMASGLKLADRWLTVRDIYSMRLEAELVVLSGCETGLNLVQGGDELMGLLRGFFVAGASNLMVTLWQVHDEVTREFMTTFYGLLDTIGPGRLGGGTIAQVLKQAQCTLLGRGGKHRHPAFWAPFTLVGRE